MGLLFLKQGAIIMKTTKKFLAMLMSIAICLGAFTGILIPAIAATGDKADIYVTHFPRAADPNQANWGHGNMNLRGNWSIEASDIFPAIALNSFSGKKVYCIEPGVSLWSGDTLEEKGESYWDDLPNLNSTIEPYQMRNLIGRILQYGYTGNVNLSWVSSNASDRNNIGNMIATQHLIWEVIVGERYEDFSYRSPPSSRDKVMDMVRSNHPCRAEIMSNYNRIVDSVQNHTTIPSFCDADSGKAQVVDLAWNGTNYSTTLTDTNSVLSQYTFSSNNSNISFSRSGNRLTITSTTAPSGTVTITAERNNSKRRGLIVWTDYHFGPNGKIQDVVDYTAEVNDPVSGYVKVRVGTGTLEILKTTQHNNGAVSGFTFEVRNSVGTLIGTYTSTSSGKISVPNLNAGTYSIKEINLSSDFVEPTPNPKTVEIRAGQTASVSFDNIKKRGIITVKKTNANPAMGGYSLAGAVFEIHSGSTLVDTVTTNAAGEAQTKILPLGTYTVTEKTAPFGFVRDKGTHTVTISGTQGTGELVYSPAVGIAEQPQTGRIRVHKQNANPSMGDYALNGAVFEIRSGTELVDTITTNASGFAQTKELPLGTYSVREKTAPWGFVLNPNSYNATLSYAGQEVSVTYTDVTIPETPQVGTITIEKLDKSTGQTAQGDATLVGAVFEIYDSSKTKLLDTLSCGNTSKAESKELPLGIYYYKEKIPPKGYTLDPDWHEVKIEYAGQNVSVNRVTADLKNRVILGQIAIVKHTDEADLNVEPGDIQIEKPLAGAKFEIFLKQSSFYGYAKETERDILITDEDGYAKSKPLPYGVYVIQEVEAPGDVKLVKPFEVFISEDGRVYRYILNDPAFRSLVKIIKVDAETGKRIPAAGTSFKVKDLATGKWVSQSFNYPVPTTIDVFETAPDGTLVMPESLKSGEYELYEQSAPWGYVLTSEPVAFTISSTQWNPEILEVVMENAPQMGTITVEKTGDMLTGAASAETIFGEQLTPLFSPTGLQGAVFEIRARDSIYTPDGTLRYSRREIVDTITTGADGKATSKPLYLGEYEVIERQAPEEFVIDQSSHYVHLVYAGQEVSVTSAQIGIENERQKVEIELQKLMEKPVNAPPNFNPYADVIFGLFAYQDIHNLDGETVISKGSLVALIQVDENGKGVVCGELPFAKYYVQELQTNAYYQLNDTQYPVNVEYAGQGERVAKIQVNNGGAALPNELKLGRITIEKTGEMLTGANQVAGKSGVMYTPVYEIRRLPGVVFDVVAAENIYDVYGKIVYNKGDVVDTVTTDADGKATSKLLHLGNYQLVEKVIPFGYVSDGKPIAVTLGLDAQFVEDVLEKSVSIFNERQKASITIDKIMELPENALANFNPYADVQFSLFAKYDIKTADGTVIIPARALLEIFGVDKNGKADIKTDLPFGSFVIKETKTAEGYKLSDAVYDVVFDYSPEEGAVIKITVNDGEPVVNDLMRGSLKIIKTFEGRETSIVGVPFTITGKTVVGTEVEIRAITDDNGEIFLEGLLIGEYKVQELASELTVGYILSEEENAIVAAGQITEMTIRNKLIRGNISLTKVDKDYPENKLTCAVFEVYEDIDGDGKITEADKFIGNLNEVETGIYMLRDLSYGNYLVRETVAPKGFYLDKGVYAVSITEDGETVFVENEAGKGFINIAMRGSLRIIKTSSDGKKEGFIFKIEGENYSETFVTDKNGIIFVDKLRIGEYVITELETEATKGYLRPDPITVEIVADETLEVKIHNDKSTVPGKPVKGPNTGDDSKLWLWASVLGASVITLLLVIFVPKKKKGKKTESKKP